MASFSFKKLNIFVSTVIFYAFFLYMDPQHSVQGIRLLFKLFADKLACSWVRYQILGKLDWED
jgi:hypothetical protein